MSHNEFEYYSDIILDDDICGENAHCVDNSGSFSCNCDSGFQPGKYTICTVKLTII